MPDPQHITVGKVGEEVVQKFLMKRGFVLIDRNYRKKWGEIDIVVLKEGILHFVEVKTVSREISPSVSYETVDSYSAADNMHPWKLKRLGRVIQTYLLDKYKEEEPDWQVDLACVYLDMSKRQARVEIVEDIDLL